MIPARMLNEYVYCPRLFALEHVNGEWADSADTVHGERVHKRVDRKDSRGDPDDEPTVRRSLDLSDPDVGVIARCDIVEFDGVHATPVDYKKGKVPSEGPWLPEKVQLCAQALLLRAHGYDVSSGILYFAGSRTRVSVPIDAELEAITRAAIAEAQAVLEASALPPPLVDSPKCPRCSLVGICLPDETNLATGKVDVVRPIAPSRSDELALYVEARGAKLGLQGGEIVVKVQGKETQRVRVRDTASVIVRGEASITTPLLRRLMERGVPVSLQSYTGWWYGEVSPVGGHNVLGRRAQHRTASEPAAALAIAKRIVAGKIRNARVLLQRNGNAPVSDLTAMKEQASQAEKVTSAAVLLGHEGSAARIYFRHFASMVRQHDVRALFDANGRSRRPPKDPLNAALSFAYGNLVRTCTEALHRVGLDPTVGIFHTVRAGRPALALDLMEEFRAVIADSSVIRAFNTNALQLEDFIIRDTGVAIKDGGRRRLIRAIEQRWAEEATHPLFERRMAYRRMVEVQARMLSKAFLGEAPYTPIRIR